MGLQWDDTAETGQWGCAMRAAIRVVLRRPPSVAMAATGPCGTTGSSTHVVWVWMENHSFGDTTDASYPNSPAAECGLATNYHHLS